MTLTAEDIREGIVGVLSVYVREPQFQGQTKERLNNPEARTQVDSVVRPALEKWLQREPSTADAAIVGADRSWRPRPARRRARRRRRCRASRRSRTG